MEIIAKLFSSRKIYMMMRKYNISTLFLCHNHVMFNFHTYNRCLSYVRAYIIL